MTDLDYENGQVLDLVQALIGAISQNMRAISLLPQGKAATLIFYLNSDSEEDREEIEDILSEYFAFRCSGEEGAADAEIVVVGDRFLTYAELKGRVVYKRKQDSE